MGCEVGFQMLHQQISAALVAIVCFQLSLTAWIIRRIERRKDNP